MKQSNNTPSPIGIIPAPDASLKWFDLERFPYITEGIDVHLYGIETLHTDLKPDAGIICQFYDIHLFGANEIHIPR